MIKKITKLACLGLLVLALLVPIAYELAYYGKIYPGITVSGINLGNLTPQQAQRKLEKEITKKTPPIIELQFEDQEWQLTTETVRVRFDFDQTISSAYQLGRRGNLLNRTKEKVNAWKNKTNLELEWQLDQKAIETKVKEIAKILDNPGKPTEVFYQGTRIFISPGQEGLLVEQKELTKLIVEHLTTLSTRTILIPTRVVNSVPDQNTISRLQKQAFSLTGKRLIVSLEEENFIISDISLISFLHYNPATAQNNITRWIADFAGQVDRLPQNARFGFQDGELSVIRPSFSGQKIDQEALLTLIKSSQQQLIDQNNSELSFPLPVQTISPQIEAEGADSLGIIERIGRGESYYRGSSASRVNNIRVASEELTGQLVAPDEVFSFNLALGEISVQTGYQTGYIIKDGRTIPGIGGGVCQVSTTLFRTILDAGLPIKERHPHAYRVGVYEQESRPGLDATVFAPQPDFKFKNDTKHYILIQTQFLPKEWKLIIDLYGTHDGRRSTLSNFRLWDITPPPLALYLDDPTLPVGEIKQIDWAAYGAKAAFDWEVVRDDKVLQKETFYSYYRAWQAKYLRGTRE